MKKILVFLTGISALFVLIMMSIMHKPTSSITKENSIIVGTNATFPPYVFMEQGSIKGFDIDLITLIAKKLGKSIVFKDMSFDSLLVEAQRGSIQVIAAGMTPTPERAKKVFFTKPHMTNDSLVAITLKPHAPQSIADLIGKEIIVNDGFTAESYMEKQEGIMLKRLETVAEAFLALTSNRGYAYISARSAAQPFFEKYGEDKFNVMILPVTESDAFAVSKKYPDLFSGIEEVLTTLETSGELKKLKQQWHLDF